MAFLFEKTEIPEVIVITPQVFQDKRGFFLETYKKSEFAKQGITAEFKQDNHSLSKKGVFRGFHYQLNPFAQGKLVRVTSGSIIDFAIDIRKGSPNYGKHISILLSKENRKMLWVPEGFAHGFYTLEDGTEVVYKATSEYSKEHEGGIVWNDEDLKIEFPSEPKIIVSDKDNALPKLREGKSNFIYS
jgi:dTDP-4-dehydrorhamnose 3,5-epimerase